MSDNSRPPERPFLPHHCSLQHAPARHARHRHRAASAWRRRRGASGKAMPRVTAFLFLRKGRQRVRRRGGHAGKAVVANTTLVEQHARRQSASKQGPLVFFLGTEVSGLGFNKI